MPGCGLDSRGLVLVLQERGKARVARLPEAARDEGESPVIELAGLWIAVPLWRCKSSSWIVLKVLVAEQTRGALTGIGFSQQRCIRSVTSNRDGGAGVDLSPVISVTYPAGMPPPIASSSAASKMLTRSHPLTTSVPGRLHFSRPRLLLDVKCSSLVLCAVTPMFKSSCRAWATSCASPRRSNIGSVARFAISKASSERRSATVMPCRSRAGIKCVYGLVGNSGRMVGRSVICDQGEHWMRLRSGALRACQTRAVILVEPRACSSIHRDEWFDPFRPSYQNDIDQQSRLRPKLTRGPAMEGIGSMSRVYIPHRVLDSVQAQERGMWDPTTQRSSEPNSRSNQ